MEKTVWRKCGVCYEYFEGKKMNFTDFEIKMEALKRHKSQIKIKRMFGSCPEPIDIKF
ncbi:MAG: hypothetical protein ACE5KE_16175 [Methanosarcinales archaeon]